MTHPKQFVHLDCAAIARVIADCGWELEQITGRPPVGFRAPGYTISAAVIDALRAAGYRYGAILATTSIDREPGDTIASAYRRLFERSAGLTRQPLENLAVGAPTIANDGAEASYYPMPTPSDVLRFMIGRRPVSAARRVT
jgi:peptidoglycan/xylan/chitin deacetylase (PgdA/CDA1 family)